MRQAMIGDTVRVHYVGTLADGTEFDNSSQRAPIEVKIGHTLVVPGFAAALVGMAEGDTKSVTLEPKDGYGLRDPQLVQVVERAQLPAEIDLRIGLRLQATDQQGNQLPLLVTALDDDEVTLDANHPLAGQTLTFQLQLVEFVG